jgi:hypothetical protein
MMKMFFEHVWTNRWLYGRLVPICFAFLDPGRETPTLSPFLPIVLFTIGMSLFLFIWIIAGPDDAGGYSLKELFLYAPMLPIRRNWCAIFSYLGICEMTMVLSSALHAKEKVWSSILINLSLAAAIPLGAIGAWWVKRNRLRRTS